MEKLQGGEDWEIWLQNMTINARIYGLWGIISGGEKKSNVFYEYARDEYKLRLRAWEQNDASAMGYIMSFLSLEIRANLAHEGFTPDTMTSNDLLTMIEKILLTKPQQENLKVIERFNSLVELSSDLHGDFIANLMRRWDRVKAKYPELSDDWFALQILSSLESHNEDESEF
jgi:hypothetical protein